MMQEKNVLVFSAHAADFVWRAGGTIARYCKAGANVHLVVLSFGVRGESNDLWKTAGRTAQEVKEIRRGESEKAAGILGLKNVEFWDLEDYPLQIDRDILDRMVKKIRQVRPDIILTHDATDVLNPDHNRVHNAVFQASIISNSAGAEYEGTKATKQMRLFGFEPHQTELSKYVPGEIIDITDTFELKKEAMNCFQAQSHLIQYYTDRAFMRGNHARRLSGDNTYRYAETFSSFFPYVGGEFV